MTEIAIELIAFIILAVVVLAVTDPIKASDDSDENIETCRVSSCSQSILDRNGFCNRHNITDIDSTEMFYQMVQNRSELTW